MDNDEFGADADFAAALGASAQAPRAPSPPRAGGNKVQQPKPQALPGRTGPSSILVSHRQKGNPILNSVRAMPWEYADIPADYVLGVTTCALFLSLKYHKIHPYYIYNRIRDLQGKYNLRVLLTMVDIPDPQDTLRELSKTSLINNVTIILCWSAQEAGRYLELFKSYEGAAPTAIRAQQATSFSDRLVDFITVPRSINKTDALGLVSAFGSVRTAVSARPEEVALVDGWGEKKVLRWCGTVREPFRVKKAAKRGLEREDSRPGIAREGSESRISRKVSGVNERKDEGMAARLGIAMAVPVDPQPPKQNTESLVTTTGAETNDGGPREPDADEEAALMEATGANVKSLSKPKPNYEKVGGVGERFSAALERLRNGE